MAVERDYHATEGIPLFGSGPRLSLVWIAPVGVAEAGLFRVEAVVPYVGAGQDLVIRDTFQVVMGQAPRANRSTKRCNGLAMKPSCVDNPVVAGH